MNNQSLWPRIARPLLPSGLAVVAVAIVSFAVGESIGQRSMRRSIGVEVDGMQAMLLIDRIVEERKVKSLFAQGCATEAKSAIDISENADLQLLADFVQGPLDHSTLAYITHQSPNILEELRTFKSKYGNTWQEPVCKDKK